MANQDFIKMTALNHAALSIRGQIGVAQSMTSGTKHTQAWNDYGYPELLTFDHCYFMYKRFGPAKAGIDMPINTCWKSNPTIYQGDDEDEAGRRKVKTQWEKKLNKLFKRLKIFSRLKAADRRQSVYQYGALIVQINGNRDQSEWSKPLDRIDDLNIVSFIPAYQIQLKPASYETDPADPRYGLPTTYNYEESRLFNDKDEAIRQRSVTIHHSRVIIFAEGAEDDSLSGTPALEAGFNHLLDMIKVGGGAAESFWQNSKLKTIFSNVDKDAPRPTQEQIDLMDDALKDFYTNLDSYILMGGLKPELLQSNMQDSDQAFKISLGMYSSSLMVPVPQNMLIGTQTGVLAGDKDMSLFLYSCQARRISWCSEMVESVVDWLMNHGVIERSEFGVVWDDLLSMSDEEKINISAKMTTMNRDSIATTGNIFTAEQIRKVAGYETSEDEAIVDSELDESENADQ